MSETQTLVHNRQPTAEIISPEQLGQLVTAVGNHEGKAMLVVDMAMAPNGDGDTQGDLHARMLRLPGFPTDKSGNRNNQTNWCVSSLVPADLVSISNSSPKRFALTEAGNQLGVPLAGWLLDFSDRNDVPLAQLFGGSASRSYLTSPQIRIDLIGELLTGDGTANLGQLVKATGVADQVVIEKHLRKLNDAGLLQYEDWNEAEHITRFEINAVDHRLSSKASPVTGAVFAYLKERASASLDEIVLHCEHLLPDEVHKPMAIDFRQQVIRSVNGLKKSGAINQAEGKRGGQRVKVAFTEEQEAMWVELLNGLELFRTADPEILARFTEAGYAVLQDPARVARAAERYTARSLRMSGDLGRLVMSALRDEASTGTVRSITTLVSTYAGAAASHYGVLAKLKDLEQEGIVRVDRDRVDRYTIPTSKD